MKLAHQLTQQVKLLHKVALITDDQILLLRRQPGAHSRPGLWDLPGGNSEWPELTSQTESVQKHLHIDDIVREVFEETQVVIDPITLKEPVCFDTTFEPKSDIFTILVGWKYKLPNQPAVQLSNEHTDFAWVRESDLHQYDVGFFGDTDGFFLALYAKAFSQSE